MTFLANPTGDLGSFKQEAHAAVAKCRLGQISPFALERELKDLAAKHELLIDRHEFADRIRTYAEAALLETAAHATLYWVWIYDNIERLVPDVSHLGTLMLLLTLLVAFGLTVVVVSMLG